MVLFAHPSGDYEIQDRYTLDRLGEILGVEITAAFLAEYDGWNLVVYKEAAPWEDGFLCVEITPD